MTTADTLDQANIAFWNTLCGTNLAKGLGITDHGAQSLARFDEWYLRFYPYLLDRVPVKAMNGARVLEVGLGYGTLSQIIMAAGADYVGLDIADGPVAMVRHRMALGGHDGEAVQGSILASGFPDESFDHIVSIGCFHHTGDTEGAITECRRLLRPGGTLTFMVYNALSYRRWWQAPGDALRHLLAGRGRTPTAAERARYDAAGNTAAPFTEFASPRRVRRMCAAFADVRLRLENISNEGPFRRWSRERLLATPLPRILGLDIYVQAVKPRKAPCAHP